MKKAKHKNILFDSDIQLSSSYVEYPFIKFFDILIAFIGVLGVIFVFLSSFKIGVDTSFITICCFCCVLFFSFVFKKLELIKYNLIGTILVFGLGLLLFHKRILDGLLAISNIAIETINNNSLIILSNDELSINLFFICIIFVISGMVCFSIIYKPNFLLLFLITFPILELGIFFDLMPSYSSLIMLVVSWISVLGMKTIRNRGRIKQSKFKFHSKKDKYIFIVNREDRGITTKIGSIIGLISVIIFIMTLIIYPPSSYKCPANITELHLEIQAYITNFDFEDLIDDLMGVAHGGVNGGKLGTVDKIKYKNETAIQVTTPWLGNDIYLKGYIGCEYTGNSWDEIDDDKYSELSKQNTLVNGFNINNTMISMLDYSKAKMDKPDMEKITITNINANTQYLYEPYNVTSQGDENNKGPIQNKKESYLYLPSNSTKYEFSYFANYANLSNAEKVENQNRSQITSLQNQESARNIVIPLENSTAVVNEKYVAIEEAKYAKFVEEVYTKLPEEGLEEIKNKYSGRYNETKDLLACINEAKAAVTDGTTYDLAPGKLPKGKDFVEYFLYENKKGYCTHFASAAAVILRAMGVPTRYVEGYVVNKDDAINPSKTVITTKSNSASNVKDTNNDFAISGNQFDIKNGKEENDNTVIQVMTMNIKDNNAHAWIEVYVENFGWVPIEVTPGFDDNSNVKKETTTKKEGTTTTTVNNSEEQNQVQKPEADTLQENTNVNTESSNAGTPIVNIILNLMILLIVTIILLLIIICIKHKISMHNRKKSFSGEDYNKNVHNIYKYLMKIFKYAKINNEDNLQIIEFVKSVEKKHSFISEGEFLEVINILFKADFSQHKISAEELEKVQRFATNFDNEIYKSLSKLQMLNYTYLKNLH